MRGLSFPNGTLQPKPLLLWGCRIGKCGQTTVFKNDVYVGTKKALFFLLSCKHCGEPFFTYYTTLCNTKYIIFNWSCTAAFVADIWVSYGSLSLWKYLHQALHLPQTVTRSFSFPSFPSWRWFSFQPWLVFSRYNKSKVFSRPFLECTTCATVLCL